MPLRSPNRARRLTCRHNQMRSRSDATPQLRPIVKRCPEVSAPSVAVEDSAHGGNEEKDREDDRTPVGLHKPNLVTMGLVR